MVWIEKHIKPNKSAWVLRAVDKLVSKTTPMNLIEKDVEQRVLMLFSDYTSLLRSNGLSWIIQDKPKTAVGHIVNALRPAPLQRSVKLDLDFAHSNLKKNWRECLRNVNSRARYCAEFEADPNPSSTSYPLKYKDDNKRSLSEAGGKRDVETSRRKKPFPDCWNPICIGKHYMKDGQNTNAEKRAEMYQKKADERTRSGDQRKTRSSTRPFSLNLSLLTSKAVKNKSPECW